MKKLFAIMLAFIIALIVPTDSLAAGSLPAREVPVTFAAISGYFAPVVGDTVSAHMGLSVPEGAHYRFAGVYWCHIDRNGGAGVSMGQEAVFEAGEIYFMSIGLEPISGYAFSDDCGVSLDSGAVAIRISRYQGGITITTPFVVCGAEQAEVIDSINVEGFELPVLDDSVNEHMALTVPEGAHYSIISMAWLYGPVENVNAAYPLMEFEEGTLYTQAVMVIPDVGYVFGANCRLLVNGSRTNLNPFASFADPGAAQIFARSHICGEDQDYVPGDATGDGSVTTEDALLVLRHALGISLLPEDALLRIDMDCDGSITTVDALLILRLALGIGG